MNQYKTATNTAYVQPGIKINLAAEIRMIRKFICDHYDITDNQLEHGKKHYPHVEARYLCAYMLDKHIYSEMAKTKRLNLIASMFSKSRSVIIRGIEMVKGWNDVDLRFQKTFKEVNQFVKQTIKDYELS